MTLLTSVGKLLLWPLLWLLRWVEVTPLLEYVERQRRVQTLKDELKEAQTYAEWVSYAEQLDQLLGNDGWKASPVSDEYDHELIARRLESCRALRQAGDVAGLMAMVHAGLSRNVGGIGHPALFQHSLVGSKRLIEAYVNEMDQCLNAIAAADTPELPLSTRIEFFAGLRKVFGRSALLLSGGATLGMYHLGVIKCLYENKMLPRIFSGSSAGSIVAAIVCTRTDEELPRMFDPANINMEAIERRGDGTLKRRINRLRKTGYFFDISVLQECIRANSGDVTFLEAYNRTRRVLNITVSSSTNYELPRLLNYLTAPDVLIWSAVSASSAIPGLYAPVPLMAKTRTGAFEPWNPAGTQWVDGSVEGDLPMARLAEQFNVNHFIVSQVNPHVIPFLQTKPVAAGRRTVWQRLGYLFSSEVQHRLDQLFELGIFPRFVSRFVFMTRSLISQTYTGDITIVPSIGYSEYLKLMTNPVAPEVRVNIRKAEHATWEKMSIIKMHCQTELTLDALLYTLRVQQVTRQGKSYRPMDFAFADEPADGPGSGSAAARQTAKNSLTNGELFGLPRRTHGYRTGRRKSSSAINGSAGEADLARAPAAPGLATAAPAQPRVVAEPKLAPAAAKVPAKAPALSGDEADTDGADGADDDAAAALD